MYEKSVESLAARSLSTATRAKFLAQRQRCAYYRGDPLNGLNGSDLTSFTGHSIPGAAAP